jgi:soluble lytic murein transglycosylase-like protein
MGDDPGSIDLYSDADDITISKEPFLYGQVVDQTGQPIRWEGRATKFADYLLQTRLKSRSNGLRLSTASPSIWCRTTSTNVRINTWAWCVRRRGNTAWMSR